MSVRRLVFSLFVAVVLAGSIVGVSGAGGFKVPSTIDPVPPVLNVQLPAICSLHFNFVKQVTEMDCQATAPNPDAPKNRTTVKFDFGKPKCPCTLTAYPDGSVTEVCRFKSVLL